MAKPLGWTILGVVQELKAAIQRYAHQLGFDGCYITDASSPEEANYLQEWLSQGRHGEMRWMERTAGKRMDPQEVLEGAASIVVLPVSYFPAEEKKATESDAHDRADPEDDARGVVARYARYRDYHKVLRKPLKELTAYLNTLGEPETRSLWYVDTGPVLERAFAQRAGAGFIGKHTNLINRALGNWVFIAEILTTLPLPPDPPEKNRCGSCRLCMDACPTEAIRAPFQLDATRCISYLTIENPGPIPPQWRAAIGNRIFGCDDCLEACPWNRFAQEGRMMAPSRKTDLDEPRLLEWLELDEETFHRQFAGTPIHRTKRRGLLRNVCVALGNVGTPSALAALERSRQDVEPLVREHAEWAIDRIRRRYRLEAADG